MMMRKRIWKFGFLLLVFTAILLSCKDNQKPLVQKFDVNGLPDFQVVFEINGHEVSAYEFIKDSTDAELAFLSKEQLIYMSKVLKTDEIKSLSQTKQDAITNPELFRSLQVGQVKSEMIFFNDDGKEISALDFFLNDFVKGGNTLKNMTKEQRLKLLNQLSDTDIEGLSLEQKEALRIYRNE